MKKFLCIDFSAERIIGAKLREGVDEVSVQQMHELEMEPYISELVQRVHLEPLDQLEAEPFGALILRTSPDSVRVHFFSNEDDARGWRADAVFWFQEPSKDLHAIVAAPLVMSRGQEFK